MKFEFATSTRILFGAGTVSQVPEAAKALGQRALLVTGRSTERATALIHALEADRLTVTSFAVDGEPTVETVRAGVEKARQAGCDLVIAMGGGSSLDTGKAIAALLTNPGDVFDYLEVIGRGQPLMNSCAAFIAIPTTSGTGSEVTKNTVIASPEHRVKVSLRHVSMLPALAVVDPELTLSLPPAATAFSGMDALTQLIEPLLSNAANPISDALAREGVRRVARSLRRAYDQGNDLTAREDMALASLFSGMALSNAKLGAVHGLAGPIGGMFPAPHGAICARLLPTVMEVNCQALRGRATDSPALTRMDEIARMLTGDEAAQAEEGIAWLKALRTDLRIPPLKDFGLTPEHYPAVAAQAEKANSMKGNPVMLTKEELIEILDKAE